MVQYFNLKLGNLIDGMPNRIKKCIELKGDILANNCSYIPIIYKLYQIA